MRAAGREPIAPLKVTTGSLDCVARSGTAKASKRFRHSRVRAE